MMAAKWKIAICSAVLIGVAATIIIVVHKRHRISLQGAVIREDSDPDKQSPLSDVEITAITGSTVSSATSDSSGMFSLTLPKGFRRRQPVTLEFRHAGYRPLVLHDFASDKLYVARMQPLPAKTTTNPDQPVVVVSNLRLRYTVKKTTEPDVGNEVKTFQIANTGDVPCKGQHPCSPDGKWKAALVHMSVDAGEGNEFRRSRVSCIAGPCPFTRIESETFSSGQRILNVTARDWSDTATFLLEAEVVHPMVSDIVRESYPVIFGRTFSFSLPAGTEGLSLEAEIKDDPIVFPLGPDLFLSWAQCTMAVSSDQNKVYRCELKPGYRFK
jgi:hypothetical protein